MKGFARTRYPNLRRNQASGVYYAFARIGKGRELARSLKTKLLTIAARKLPRVLRMLRSKSGRVAEDLTLGECAEIYLERKRAEEIKPRSLAYRSETVKMLRRSWCGFDACRAAETDETHCRLWAATVKSKRTGRRFSATRFNGMVESLRGIFQVALEAGVIEQNPALQVERLRVRPTKRNLPSREMFGRILQALDGHAKRKHAALSIRALAFTGLRPNEARNLTVEDVNLAEATLLARVTKNSEPRMIFLIPQAVELFTGQVGAVVAALKRSPKKALQTVCRDLDIPPLTPYDFRHLYFTRCLESGMDVAALALQAGHKDKGVTLLRTYVHAPPEHVRAMAKKVAV